MLKKLTVRPVAAHERDRANDYLRRDHYLGDAPRGSMPTQVVEYDGRWVALLDWGPAAARLADRDEWIGWG